MKELKTLRELRKDKGKTLQQVEMDLKEMGYDINYSGICKYERGIQRTTEYAKKAFCDYYGVDDFIEESNEYLEMTKEIKEKNREIEGYKNIIKNLNEENTFLKKQLSDTEEEHEKLKRKLQKLC